jgi:DNA-binding winged helix-turn-helix (wHTH) protein/TolB-like protein/tetratricopeptide (TPR) repeat protein
MPDTPCYDFSHSSAGRWNMGSAVSFGPIFRFGLFEADVARHTLTCKGVRVRIPDQSFQVLVLLLKKPGEIVIRGELHKALWPEGTYVDFDGSLNVILKRLRAAIDDDSDNPRFIETVPRRGYRFIAPVSIDQPVPALDVGNSGPKFRSVSAVTLSTEGPRKVTWGMTLALAVGVLLVAGCGWWYFLRHQSVVHAAPKAIAVLPFTNEGAGSDFDYLRYAIANDLVTDFSHTPSINVRPVASTSKYATQPFDPATSGKELRVSHVVEGSFLKDQKSLRVNLELVDVARNQVVWRDEVTVGTEELITLHDKLVVSATKGLLPALDISDATKDEIPSPKNEEAFYLFLHAVTVPLDPVPNQTAITKLEESVSLDSQYAPAWGEMGWRYYLDYRYGKGGEDAKTKCLQAFKRLYELDPNAPAWTTIRVEQGDLDGAYNQLAQLLQKRPGFSGAHFGMSYVLRYAGLLKEAGRECDKAFALDPVNGYRSCATVFILRGEYAHAKKYINLDKDSGVAALMRMVIALRMRDSAAVLAEINAAEQRGYRSVNAGLVRAYLSHASAAELAKAVADVEGDPVSSRDPELLYQNAEALAFCGQSDPAIRQLGKAIKGNYCSYPAMDQDPLFDSIRQRQEFAELRQAATQCQQSFLTHRKQVDATFAVAW